MDTYEILEDVPDILPDVPDIYDLSNIFTDDYNMKFVIIGNDIQNLYVNDIDCTFILKNKSIYSNNLIILREIYRMLCIFFSRKCPNTQEFIFNIKGNIEDRCVRLIRGREYIDIRKSFTTFKAHIYNIYLYINRDKIYNYLTEEQYIYIYKVC